MALTPSRLGEHAQSGGVGRGRTAALEHGSAVHLLLERLSGEDLDSLDRLGARLLTSEFPGLSGESIHRAIEEARNVLTAPFAPSVFTTGAIAEASLTISLPALGGSMVDRADRIIIKPDHVLVVDFKTDADPPVAIEEVSDAYLVQLGAYRAALAEMFPGREVTAALLWTAAPVLMAIPERLLDEKLAEAMARMSIRYDGESTGS